MGELKSSLALMPEEGELDEAQVAVETNAKKKKKKKKKKRNSAECQDTGDGKSDASDPEDLPEGVCSAALKAGSGEKSKSSSAETKTSSEASGSKQLAKASKTSKKSNRHSKRADSTSSEASGSKQPAKAPKTSKKSNRHSKRADSTSSEASGSKQPAKAPKTSKKSNRHSKLVDLKAPCEAPPKLVLADSKAPGETPPVLVLAESKAQGKTPPKLVQKTEPLSKSMDEVRDLEALKLEGNVLYQKAPDETPLDLVLAESKAPGETPPEQVQNNEPLPRCMDEVGDWEALKLEGNTLCQEAPDETPPELVLADLKAFQKLKGGSKPQLADDRRLLAILYTNRSMAQIQIVKLTQQALNKMPGNTLPPQLFERAMHAHMDSSYAIELNPQNGKAWLRKGQSLLWMGTMRHRAREAVRALEFARDSKTLTDSMMPEVEEWLQFAKTTFDDTVPLPPQCTHQ